MGGATQDYCAPSRWKPSPLLVICFALLLRYMVSLWPYSGEAQQPMHGDYEAQRHWMEVTTALPLHQWYRFDLEYWGLDYPPLTAYVSWVCGKASAIVEPASMLLGRSRGYETPSHKAFMRLTVLVLDLGVFFGAAAALAHRLTLSARKSGSPAKAWSAAARMYAMVLLQPCLIVIDHGHFQYNSVCLGLAVAGAAAVSGGRFQGELLGSVLFSLSLNFKQMALYYSPAFFFWLLASCMWSTASGTAAVAGGRGDGTLSARWAIVIGRVLGLGAAVALTFASLWAPFCIFSGVASGGTCLSSLRQVLVRMFPFSRGLFEDKVANVWFCLDVFLNLRQRLATPHLAKLSLVSTLSLLLPVAAELLRPKRPLTARRLVLAMFNSSMAFFLCSFQVHEKSLLLPLCPLSFLWSDSPLVVTWLQVLGMFSMTPLLGREGLLVPCAVCTLLYVGASVVLTPSSSGALLSGVASEGAPSPFPYGRYITEARLQVLVAFSVAGIVSLSVLEATLPPPAALPHLHPTLNALYCGANLTLAYGLGVYWQWRHQDGCELIEEDGEDRWSSRKDKKTR